MELETIQYLNRIINFSDEQILKKVKEIKSMKKDLNKFKHERKYYYKLLKRGV
jgi:hypothetical protein